MSEKMDSPSPPGRRRTIVAPENSNVLRPSQLRPSQMSYTRKGMHAKIFASMCPDEILDYYDSYETRSYETTLMLGDVSGFTDMTEKFTKSGKGGPSKLTETLNSYIGAMVQEILSHGGDVLKFSGDAFIVMWKLKEGRPMRDIATEAIHTACIIQKHFGTYKTEIDVELKVKLAIASGKTYFTSIGDPKSSSYYIIIGKPVWEVKFAEALCRGGDILVAPSCWQYVNPNEYIYNLLPDGVHIHITSLSVLWHTKSTYSTDNMDILEGTMDSEASTTFSDESSKSSSASSEEAQVIDTNMYQNVVTDYSLRSKIILAALNELSSELRTYVPRPVIRLIEMDQPMEYLTEIRHVVIVFVNVITKDINRRTLIQLVQTAYKFVCSIVNDMQGCVNKTSLFDKDLLFLCVFGLRGDKHELESQIGLRCASLLRRGLSKYRHIDSVTVGVTTGMSYCGVVGHVLRREYTVIGMAVNKAARLMCAYTNKVVCDRESFLQSHLEAKHFILQEPKHLKGITKVGPIYEFVEKSSIVNHELNVAKFPLLGRDDELNYFIELTNKLTQEGGLDKNEITNNVMILRGDPRIGKTRLLEELAHITHQYLRVNFVSLTTFDQQFPFVLLRLILDGLLDLDDVLELDNRESQLKDLLKDAEEPLCLLNQVFAVNFPPSGEYNALSPNKRRRRLRRLLRRLMRNCVNSAWLVIVDDAELADEDSLAFFSDITRYKSVLFVLAYGNKLSKDYLIPENINKMATFVELHGLDKWFHTGLACQVMDVIAIPAELEKALQERSWGNPGWIESYLVSLLQSHGAVIEKKTYREIQEMGLVVPSLDLLQRSDKKHKIVRRLSKFKEHSIWKMFRFTFKDNYAIDQRKQGKGESNVKYSVCLLSADFTLGEGDAEITIDTILVKLYDSLTPLDQYFIKCAAVLGETIDRKMLETLFHETSEREIALCVVKLFELRIIGCAVGDFSRSPGPMMLFKKSHTADVDIQARCGCKNITIPPDLADLPDYASCGLMRFKLDMFRETTYSLLTENQKVEFHSKALRYLQKNARRCQSCGEGQFNTLLGESTLPQIARQSIVEDPVIIELTRSTSFVADKIEETLSALQTPTKEKKGWFQSYKPLVKSPTRTFSHIDLSNCDCNLILLTLYTQVLKHCRGIKIKPLLLVAILEFVVVCISTLNIPQATKLLHEAEELIDAIYNAPEDALLVLPRIKAKVMTLRGQCFLESGLLTEAMTCFEETLRVLGYKFPTNRTAINLKSAIMLRQLLLTLTILRHLRIGIVSGDEAKFTDQFAKCLTLMFTLFRMKGMYEQAKLAAIWGLNTALASNKDFLVLCTSYAHMLLTAHDNQYKTIIPLLEKNAVNLCTELNDSIETQELRAIAELYAYIFESRWLRGLRYEATSIGHIAVRLTTASASYDYKLVVLPKVIQLITSQSLFDEAILLLQELEVISQTSMDLSGSTWYYALSVNLILESGISIVSLRECEEFYQQESSKIMDAKDIEATHKFFICMWLWYIRIGDWESAYVWKERQCGNIIFNKFTATGAMIELQKLEGLIINYVARVEFRNYNDAKALLGEVKAMIKEVQPIRKIVKIVHARYYLMQAYYNMIILRRKTGMSLVKKVKKIAHSSGNFLIYDWAEHNEKAWLGFLSEEDESSWKVKCVTRQKNSEIHPDSKYQTLPYTLPILKKNH